MNDNRIIVLLTRKIAGEINEIELEELTNLLAENPDALYYEEFVKELWQKNENNDKDLRAFYDRHKTRHLEKLDFNRSAELSMGHSSKREKNSLFRNKTLLYGAVAAVLCIISFSIFFNRYIYEKNSENRIEIVAEKGVRKQLLLPDGTKVWLNADSRLSYNNFTEDTRMRSVNLAGEAYFDVAKDKNRPFIIQTAKISIRVLGTAFNVKAYPNEPKTETTLIRGAIELSVNERPEEKILLKPSEKIAVIDSKMLSAEGEKLPSSLILTIGSLSKIHVDNKEYIQETSWITDKLVFKDETMEELIPKLERWYNVSINLESPKIKRYRYTATITKENINEVLNAMQLIKPFNFKIERNDITIY